METVTTFFGIDPSLRSTGLACLRVGGGSANIVVGSIQVKDKAGSWPGIYAVSSKQYEELGDFIGCHWCPESGPVFGIMEHPIPSQRPGPCFVAGALLAHSFKAHVGKDPVFIHPEWLGKLCGIKRVEKDQVREFVAEIISLNGIGTFRLRGDSRERILPEGLEFDESDASLYTLFLAFGRGYVTKLPPGLNAESWTLELKHVEKVDR